MSWGSTMSQDISDEEKITIPRADFDNVLNLMETIRLNIDNQRVTAEETASTTTCCCEQRQKFYCSICKEMIHSDNIIYTFFNYDTVNICQTCFEQAGKDAFKLPVNGQHSAANGSHGASSPTKKCVIAAPPEIISSIKEKDQIQIAEQEEGAALEFVLEESHQDLFEFFEGLGTSTAVLQEVRRR